MGGQALIGHGGKDTTRLNNPTITKTIPSTTSSVPATHIACPLFLFSVGITQSPQQHLNLARLLPFTVTRPVTVQEMSIAFDARDTKLDSWRELTNGNLFSVRFFEEWNRADCSTTSPTIAE